MLIIAFSMLGWVVQGSVSSDWVVSTLGFFVLAVFLSLVSGEYLGYFSPQ